MNSVIVFPRLHADHTSCEVDEIRQRPRHGTEDTGYTLLPWHTGFRAHLWPSPGRAAKGVDAREVSGHPDRTCNVGADTDPATPIGEERTFTASRSAGGVFVVVWVG